MLAGLANTLAFAPYTLWWLPILTLALLALAIQHSGSARQAAGYGFSYGLGWFGLGVSWVHVSIDQFGGLPLAGSLGLMALLVGYLALFPALTAWLSRKLCGSVPFPLLLLLCWTGSEWLRSVLFTGFPWLSLGYSQTDSWFRHYAPLVGEIGISAILVFIAASVAQLVQRSWRQSSLWPLAISSLLVVLAPFSSQFKGWHYTEQQLKVLLVQGNIQQELRWVPELEWPTMLKYLDLTRPHLAEHQLVIWPEAAVPRIEPLAGDFLENLDKSAFYSDTAIITGILDYKLQTDEAWNNLIVVGKDSADASSGHYFHGHRNRFSKHHLLPIGEFVPFESFLRQLAPIFDLPMSSFNRGSFVQPNLLANGFQILPAICFEIAFPAQIRANLRSQTQLLLTVSNDAWFGDSIGPHQHLQIARMRALEFGLPLLRATNTGITATIDADGRIREQAPQFTEAVLSDTLQLTRANTFYTQFGNLPLFSFSTLLLAIALFRYWRKAG